MSTRLVLLSFVFRLGYGQSPNCSFKPVPIPFTWVTLENEGSIRGAAASAGSPAQNFSFLPVIELNNTFMFYSSKDCDVTLEACLTHRGGFFTPENSSTFQNDSSATPTNNFWEPTETMSNGDVAVDKFNLLNNFTIPEFPFGIVHDEVPVPLANGNKQASFGLGRNSTVLSMLKKAGTIGSSSWGYCWGLDGATDQAKMDGNLLLGGYDQAKIKNLTNNYTGVFTDPAICPQGMAITLYEIQLNFPDNSISNLLGKYALELCICPQCPFAVSFPYDPYYERFEDVTATSYINQSNGINFFDTMYWADEVYQGDLTLVLDTGLSIRIPNNQLAIPDLTIGGNGTMQANTSVRDLMMASLGDGQLAQIGRVFFTAAYLWINHDDRTFTIWEANPTTDTNVISVAGSELEQQCAADVTIASSPHVPSQTGPNASSTKSKERRNLSGGAIAGIVIGILAALGIMGAVLFLLRVKQRRKRDMQNGPPDMPYADELHDVHVQTPMVEAFAEHPEVKGDDPDPQELPGDGPLPSVPLVHELQ